MTEPERAELTNTLAYVASLIKQALPDTAFLLIVSPFSELAKAGKGAKSGILQVSNIESEDLETALLRVVADADAVRTDYVEHKPS